MIKSIIFVCLSVVTVISCSKNNLSANIDCSTAKSFATDVLPVIQSACSTGSSCHASGSSHGVFINYSQIYAGRAAIRSSVVNGSMPEGGSLTASRLNAIVCWIDSGAADN